MTTRLLVAGLLAGVMCMSCVQNDQDARNSNQKQTTLAGTADKSKNKLAGQGEVRIPDAPIAAPAPGESGSQTNTNTAAKADLSDVPLAPKDAKWTVFCATIADANHVETSRGLKDALIQRTGMREWYILHESGQSRLYYGFYRSINDTQNDAAETRRAQADRKKIDELVDGSGQRPFRACQFVQLNAPDPDAPPEWNLVNAPADKKWTLMVGAYKDSPDRKKFAVDAVRDARARGEEAYYYHGDNVSNVFIGAWPEEAVNEVRLDPDPAAAKNGSGDVLVLPPGVKPEAGVRDRTGRRVRAVSQELVAVDETLKQKIAQYPNMGVNGEFLVYKAHGKTRLEGSKVIRIPRPSETTFRENVAAGDNALEPKGPYSRPGYHDTSANKPRPAAKGADPGQLRSLDQ